MDVFFSFNVQVIDPAFEAFRSNIAEAAPILGGETTGVEVETWWGFPLTFIKKDY